MRHGTSTVHQDAHLATRRMGELTQVSGKLGRDNLTRREPAPIEIVQLTDLRRLEAVDVAVDSRQTFLPFRWS